jgi:hypothetical protein
LLIRDRLKNYGDFIDRVCAGAGRDLGRNRRMRSIAGCRTKLDCRDVVWRLSVRNPGRFGFNSEQRRQKAKR